MMTSRERAGIPPLTFVDEHDTLTQVDVWRALLAPHPTWQDRVRKWGRHLWERTHRCLDRVVTR
jgi:hypothetical protein